MPGLILMTGLGHLPITCEAASTCDMSYLDTGRACAWNTFFCEDFVNNGIVPDTLQTCFFGSQQSPINLDVNEAEVRDPGQLTFNGYEAQLSQTPFIRIRSFALRLDFEEMVQPTRQATTTTTPLQLPSITGGALGAKT